MLQAGFAGQEQPVIQHHAAAPFRRVQQDQIFIGGLQHQKAAAGVFGLDGGLAGGLAPDGFAQKVADPLDAGGGVDVAQHPLHTAGLDGHGRAVEMTDQLALFDVHLGAVVGGDGGIRGDAEVPLVLDDLERTQLCDDLDVVVVGEIGDLIHNLPPCGR